jgi:O-antigen/teichoic acid export membrane protein
MSGAYQFFIMILIARHLGVSYFGIYTFSITIAGILGIVSDFGICQLMIREVAKDKDKASVYFLNGSIIKFLLNFFVFLIFYFLITEFNFFDYKSTILLACVSSMLLVFTNFYISFFNAYEKMHITAALSALQSILASSACLLILLLGLKNVNYFFIAHIIINIFMMVFSLLLTIKKISLKNLRTDFKFSFYVIKDAIPFSIFILAGMLYFQIDTVMLSVMKDQNAVGIYQAPFRLIMTLDIIPLLLSTAIYPTISKAFIESKDQALTYITKLLIKSLYIGLPIALGMSLFSKQIIILGYGDQFSPSISTFTILAWIFPIRVCCHILGAVLLATNFQNIRALATVLAAFFNVVLNLFLIPYYSYNGAAFASVITSGFLAVFYFCSIQKEMKNTLITRALAFLFISVSLAGMTVYLTKDTNTYTSVISAAIVYCICILSFNAIERRVCKY